MNEKEQTLGEKRREALRRARLYALVDLGYVEAGKGEHACAALIEGGADLIQLRAKGEPESRIISVAEAILPICRSAGIPLIINDFPELVSRTGADGGHIGQDDGTLTRLRELAGTEILTGRSTHSFDQAEEAMREGFDCIGFGPLFATDTKPGRPPIGLEDISRVRALNPEFPVFCIGGINERTLDTVLEAGANRVVVVSALLKAADIAAATREIRNRLP